MLRNPELKARRVLEKELSGILGQSNRKLSLEQYSTDVTSASELLFSAYNDGNLEGRSVIDLGAGNGILAVGAALLGAASVTAVEYDPALDQILRKNVSNYQVEVVISDVASIRGRWDTTVMNPPWGSQARGADRPFIGKAVEISNHIYAIHNHKSAEFLKSYYSSRCKVVKDKRIRIPLEKQFSHQGVEKMYVDAILISAHV